MTMQKSKTAVKALLHDISVNDHQPKAIFPKVGFATVHTNFVEVEERIINNDFPSVFLTLLVGRQEGHLACKKQGVGLLVVTGND